MKIIVPSFVTEENVQTAMKRLAMKGTLPDDARIIAGCATALGLLEQLGPDAAAKLPPADIPAAELGETDQTAPFLPPEQMDFVKADCASRGIDTSQFESEFRRLAPLMTKLIKQPKKEISVTLPEEFECIGRGRSAWCKRAELSGS